MTESLFERIREGPAFSLKPNPYLKDPAGVRLYQRRGSMVLVARKRLILGDDTGLGKTLEAIVAIAYLRVKYPDLRWLVLTEKTVVRQWKEEFEKFSHGLQVQTLVADDATAAGKKRAFASFDGDVIITSYSLLYDYLAYIQEGLGPRFAVVFDEPPFRNPKAQISKLSYDLVEGAERVYGLTATVVNDRLEEAWGIYKVIAPWVFGTKTAFLRDYCVTKPVFYRKPWPVRVVKYVNLAKFRETIRPYFYGRLATHSEVDKELPQVITKDVKLRMSAAQTGAVVDAMNGLLRHPHYTYTQVDRLAAISHQQQLVNDPRGLGLQLPSVKTEAVVGLLTNELAGQKVIVFSKRRKTIELISAQLKLKKTQVEHAILWGKQGKTAREKAIDGFQKGSVPVLLMTQAGGKALNLQRGAHLLVVDSPWTYGSYHQLVGRIKRVGSKNARVVVYRLVAELDPKEAARRGIGKGRTVQTIDHSVLKHVKRGQAVFAAVTGDATGIEVTNDDIASILADLVSTTKGSGGDADISID